MTTTDKIAFSRIKTSELVAMRSALNRCHLFFTKVLPQCDLAGSALDANSWRLINKVPTEVRRILYPPMPKPAGSSVMNSRRTKQ